MWSKQRPSLSTQSKQPSCDRHNANNAYRVLDGSKLYFWTTQSILANLALNDRWVPFFFSHALIFGDKSYSLITYGRELWNSDFEWRLMIKRLWVRVPQPYTWWNFFTFVCCKNCAFWKDRKSIKGGRGWPNKNLITYSPNLFCLGSRLPSPVCRLTRCDYLMSLWPTFKRGKLLFRWVP